MRGGGEGGWEEKGGGDGGAGGEVGRVGSELRGARSED